MVAGTRIGIAGLGVTSPLGDTPEANWERLVADRLSDFLQGLDACPLDSVPFAHDISTAFDVVEAAPAS